ncbi:MAG: hypothetical protein ABID38_02465 [Candidatus Diapherotrites archaeon]
MNNNPEEKRLSDKERKELIKQNSKKWAILYPLGSLIFAAVLTLVLFFILGDNLLWGLSTYLLIFAVIFVGSLAWNYRSWKKDLRRSMAE